MLQGRRGCSLVLRRKRTSRYCRYEVTEEEDADLC